MELLAAYGTDEQKARWLYPLMNQEIWSAYSMTEPQGGSDPNLFRTTATRDGDERVINGEKWFTSAGRYADILFGDSTSGMFVVPTKTPGVEFVEDGPGSTPTSATTRCGSCSTTCSACPTAPRCWPSGGWAAGIHHAMRSIASASSPST